MYHAEDFNQFESRTQASYVLDI